MKRHHIFVTGFYIYSMFALTNGETNLLFKRRENAEGKLCKDMDSVFDKTQIYDKSLCLFECAKDSGCKSVFHARDTGNCTGCAASFDISTQPSGQDEGFRYYKQQLDTCCTEGWNSLANSCYFITEQNMNFRQGLETCQAFNAYPVTVDSEEENNYLKTLINSTYTYTDDVLAFFIGFTDIGTEDAWVKHGTNDQMIFQDWGNNEPNGRTTENCAAFYFSLDLKWADIPCSIELRMICEMEALA